MKVSSDTISTDPLADCSFFETPATGAFGADLLVGQHPAAAAAAAATLNHYNLAQTFSLTRVCVLHLTTKAKQEGTIRDQELSSPLIKLSMLPPLALMTHCGWLLAAHVKDTANL